MKKLICCFSLLLACFISCNGQSKHPKLIRNQNLNPANNVHCGLKDKAGNLWFGTTGDGVYCYDGKSFINFTMKDGLSSNTIWFILEDKTGKIWFGTADGISLYDGKKFTAISIVVANSSNLYPYSPPAGDPSSKNAVWSILQDKSGKLWFGTDEGIYCYNGTIFTRFLDNDNIINKEGLHLKRVEALLEDKTGNIWFASWDNEGICRFDGKSLTNFKPNGDMNFKRILEDKNGILWFASRPNRVYSFDGKTFSNLTEKEGIRGVTWILEDKNGIIWFSGDEEAGLWRFDGNSYSKFTSKDGLSRLGVWCIVEDKNGNIWVGTRNTGLYRYDGKTFTNFSE